jgi:hypothetical protein
MAASQIYLALFSSPGIHAGVALDQGNVDWV